MGKSTTINAHAIKIVGITAFGIVVEVIILLVLGKEIILGKRIPDETAIGTMTEVIAREGPIFGKMSRMTEGARK